MKNIYLLAILTFTAITSPLHAMLKQQPVMLKRDDRPILQKRLGQDVQKVEQAEDPDQMAKAIISEAKRWDYNTGYYVCEAAKQKCPKAFTAFINGKASLHDDDNVTAMDASLSADFIHGIDELFNKDQSYTCNPQSLAACNADTLMHFADKVHEFRKDNRDELIALCDAVVIHCDPKVSRQFLQKDDYGYHHVYKPSDEKIDDPINEKTIRRCKAYLKIYAQDAQHLPQKPYHHAKFFVLHNALWNLNAKFKESQKYNETFKEDTHGIRDMLNNHPITFSDNEKILAYNTYAVGIRHDDCEVLNKLESLNAPMPDVNELSQYMLRRLSVAVTQSIPLSDSSPQMVEWCLKHKANPSLETHTLHSYYRNGYKDETNIDCHPFKSIISCIQKNNSNKSTLEICKKLYALMKNNGAQLSVDAWKDMLNKTGAQEAITFLSTEDEAVLKQPALALIVCRCGESNKNEDLVNRFYPYTPDGHYTTRKYLAALRNMLTSQLSRPNYLALPTSEAAAQSRELVVVNDDNNDKKNQ